MQAGPVVAIIQPVFYRVPDQRPVRNSARTVVAYYELTNGSELTPCPAADEPGAQARTAAAQVTAHRLQGTLQPEAVRDAQGTLIALKFHSRDVALSSLLLLPETWNQFSRVLGPDCLAVVPNREVLFLFPRLGGNLRSFAVEVLTLYRNHPYPGSTEALEWRDNTLRAVHDFEADFVE